MNLFIDLTKILDLKCYNPLVSVTPRQWLACKERWPEYCFGDEAAAEQYAGAVFYTAPAVTPPYAYQIDLTNLLEIDSPVYPISVAMDQWLEIFKRAPGLCFGGKSKNATKTAAELQDEKEPSRGRLAPAGFNDWWARVKLLAWGTDSKGRDIVGFTLEDILEEDLHHKIFLRYAVKEGLLLPRDTYRSERFSFSAEKKQAVVYYTNMYRVRETPKEELAS